MADDEMGITRRHGSRILPAVSMIALGAIFLCITLGVRFPFLDRENWWAWFMLTGTAWPLSEAWARYRTVGRVDGEVCHFLLHVLAIVMLAMIFILGLSWAKWWPLFVICGGLCMLVREPRRRCRERVR